MNTPLFLLRALQTGLSMRDMDDLSIGLVLDIFTEKVNDSVKYPDKAGQEDFDKF